MEKSSGSGRLMRGRIWMQEQRERRSSGEFWCVSIVGTVHHQNHCVGGSYCDVRYLIDRQE